MYRDSNIVTFSQLQSLFSLKCALPAQSALPGALPFSFSSWNTVKDCKLKAETDGLHESRTERV